MGKYFFLFSTLLLLFSCSLSASQEQELSKQTGIYLDAKEKKSILVIVSKTHPSFVKYVKSKGSDYFQKVFEEEDLEDLIFIDPIIEKIETKNSKIHVLYNVKKEYIKNGENKVDELKFVAISEDDGENWFFLNNSVYKNKKICKDIERLIK